MGDVSVHGLTRRGALKLLGATATVAACAPATSSGPAASPALQPKAGGVLRINALEPTTLDGHRVLGDNHNTVSAAYDRLTAYDATLKPQASLAESFEVSSDAKQVKFTLRKGIQFHNGRELTSDDVKYSVLRVRDPKVAAGNLKTQSEWFTSVETPDKYTVVLKSDQPRPFMFDFFEYFNILDKGTMEGPNAKTTIVGTGPFMWKDYVPGQAFRLTKNPNYWRSGRPYLDEMRYTIMADAQAIIVNLEAGQLDMVQSPSTRDADRLRKDAKFRLLWNELSGTHHLVGVMADQKPFDDKRVRQALNYAIDRKRIVETVLLGQAGEARALPWPLGTPASEPAKNNRYPFDLDKARALLKDAGNPTIDFEIRAVGTNGERTGMAQIIQADLQKIGLKPTLKTLDDAAFRSQNDTGGYRGFYVHQSGFAQVGPAALGTLSAVWNPDNTNTKFKSAAWSKIVRDLTVEPSLDKQKALYAQLNDLILEESFLLTISASPETVITTASVHGVKWDMHGARTSMDIWIE